MYLSGIFAGELGNTSPLGGLGSAPIAAVRTLYLLKFTVVFVSDRPALITLFFVHYSNLLFILFIIYSLCIRLCGLTLWVPWSSDR